MMHDAKADTTDNQLNADMEDGFLDSTYDYPNIHTHKQLGITDNTIFTGSSFYDNEASQTVNTSVIGELDQLDGINYGVDYYSQNRGTITLKADFYDDAGIFLDNDGGTYQITSGSWQSLTNTYNEAEYLNDIFTITITIGGESEYAYGTDDIQLRDAYVTYDYSEIPLVEILEDTTLDELIMDLIEGGAEVEFIEEVVSEAEVLVDDAVEEDEQEVEETESSDTEEDEQEVEETDDETEGDEQEDEQEVEETDDETEGDEQDTDNESNESTEENSNDTESVTMDTGNTQQNSLLSNTLSSGEEVLNLLDMVQNTNNLIHNTMVLTDTIDFRSYTGLALRDTVELEDNNNWYEEQAFYDGNIMPDSQILSNYKYMNMQDNKEWY
jgi:hypothetical protein